MTFCNVYTELSNRDHVIFSKTNNYPERERQRERAKWQITNLGEGLIVLCTISAPFSADLQLFQSKT